MGLKSALLKPFAKSIARNIQRWASNPIQAQQKIFKKHIRVGQRRPLVVIMASKTSKPMKIFASKFPCAIMRR